jgi:hypothetical protein
MHPFAINSGINAGWNWLDMVVYNEPCPGCGNNPNPVGARMEIASVPEPGSVVLVALGLAGLAGFARRRKK